MVTTAGQDQPGRDRDRAGAARPFALVTGAGRTAGIGAGIASQLAASGWDIAFTYWSRYDERMPWGAEPAATAAIQADLAGHGAATVAVEADLERTGTAARIYDETEQRLGGVTALVMCHCESVASGLLDTTADSFDRHFAVNARATWLLIREHARRFAGAPGTGRVISLTSDHTAGNLPYGASKGAQGRITLAAARELAHLGITANVINPGPVDTGWMTDQISAAVIRQTPPAASAPPAIPPAWSTSCAPRKAAGSTASS